MGEGQARAIHEKLHQNGTTPRTQAIATRTRGAVFQRAVTIRRLYSNSNEGDCNNNTRTRGRVACSVANQSTINGRPLEKSILRLLGHDEVPILQLCLNPYSPNSAVNNIIRPPGSGTLVGAGISPGSGTLV
jgi:hypothetical protein